MAASRQITSRLREDCIVDFIVLVAATDVTLLSLEIESEFGTVNSYVSKSSTIDTFPRSLIVKRRLIFDMLSMRIWFKFY